MGKQQQSPILQVLKRPGYMTIFLAIAILFFLINIYIPNISLLFNGIGKYPLTAYMTLAAGLFQGGIATLATHAVILLAIISVLTGLVVMLITYKVRTARQGLRGTKAATMGAIFGVAAPACAACGIGLLSLLGLGSAVAYLPFQGTEVAVASVGLLGFATHSLNKSMKECDSCQIDLKKFKKR